MVVLAPFLGSEEEKTELRKETVRGNEEIECDPKISEATEVRLLNCRTERIDTIRHSFIGHSKAQEGNLDLLERRFLEHFTLRIDRMHIRPPEGVEEFRLCP